MKTGRIVLCSINCKLFISTLVLSNSCHTHPHCSCTYTKGYYVHLSSGSSSYSHAIRVDVLFVCIFAKSEEMMIGDGVLFCFVFYIETDTKPQVTWIEAGDKGYVVLGSINRGWVNLGTRKRTDEEIKRQAGKRSLFSYTITNKMTALSQNVTQAGLHSVEYHHHINKFAEQHLRKEG